VVPDLSAFRTSCPSCGGTVAGVFPASCPHCPFTIDALAGRGTSQFQRIKWGEHSDILAGRAIQLYGKTMNASFDFRGQAALDDLVRFTLTFGDRASLPTRDGHANPVIVSFIPKPIGAGTVLYQAGTVPCSGICIVSAHSIQYGHSFPVIGPWVQQKFQRSPGLGCRICSSPTSFAQPVCDRCYTTIGGDWMRLVE